MTTVSVKPEGRLAARRRGGGGARASAATSASDDNRGDAAPAGAPVDGSCAACHPCPLAWRPDLPSGPHVASASPRYAHGGRGGSPRRSRPRCGGQESGSFGRAGPRRRLAGPQARGGPDRRAPVRADLHLDVGADAPGLRDADLQLRAGAVGPLEAAQPLGGPRCPRPLRRRAGRALAGDADGRAARRVDREAPDLRAPAGGRLRDLRPSARADAPGHLRRLAGAGAVAHVHAGARDAERAGVVRGPRPDLLDPRRRERADDGRAGAVVERVAVVEVPGDPGDRAVAVGRRRGQRHRRGHERIRGEGGDPDGRQQVHRHHGHAQHVAAAVEVGHAQPDDVALGAWNVRVAETPVPSS